MRLVLNTSYKSLEAFDIELPDFTILTGVNGSGKTHILKGIEEEYIDIYDKQNKNLSSVKYLNSSNWELDRNITQEDDNRELKVEALWGIYNKYIQSKGSIFESYFENILYSGNINKISIIESIARKSKKDIDSLTLNDFYNNYSLNGIFSSKNTLCKNIESLFKRYYDFWEQNEYKEFRNKVKNENNSYLTKEEFEERYGEMPWILMDKVMHEAKLDYRVNYPITSSKEKPFELKLIHNLTQKEIQFNDLSSGERTLIFIVLSLYNMNYTFNFPKVLLIDEPDAFLHPSMCKTLLNVLQKVFVEDKKMKVIISSHSASTIALAPESAIYVVNKTGTRIEKTSKDKALKVLTSGVPAFSVNYENRRQVFVESEYDVAYYEALYKILSRELNSEVSLNFIASGDSRTDKNGQAVSNCVQVEHITHTLRKAGNKFIYGIIDWDTKNKCSDGVKVLGEGKRYSIENYILDPLLVGIILWREKYINNEDLNLSEDKPWRYVDSFEIADLQTIVDFVIDKLSIDKSEPVACRLINDKVINIPKAYLEHQGHSLEEKLLKAFPKLNEIKAKKEDGLKFAIINKVVEDFNGLLSVDVLDLLKSIQEV